MRSLSPLVGMLALVGCATGRYSPSVPPARSGVLAYSIAPDVDARRAAVIARRLSTAKPLPVDRVLVASSGFLNSQYGAGRFPDDNAGASPCGAGDSPPSGCIYVGNRLLSALSDDALAGVLAHELGHLERGHRRPVRTSDAATVCQEPAHSLHQAFVRLFAGCGISRVEITVAAAAEAHASRRLEREADEAAIDRLAAARYCAGPLMRATFAELFALFPEQGRGGLLASHPGYQERWEHAGSDCRRSAR